MAQAAASARGSHLGTRVASALVLAPLVVVAVVAGRPWFDLLVGLSATLLAWEWARLCQDGQFGASGKVLAAACVACVGALALVESPHGWVAVITGLLLAGVGVRLVGSPRPVWMTVGFLYIALPCFALLWLRQRPGTGLDLVLLVMIVTWAGDTGGFFVGRAVGGPRLAPRISPAKTWSGFAGGLAAAAIAGTAYAILRRTTDPAEVAAVSLTVAALAAGGDLLESAAKRRFHVKDAGTLIPGHGGLLDRADGLLLAAMGVALLVLLGWDFPL